MKKIAVTLLLACAAAPAAAQQPAAAPRTPAPEPPEAAATRTTQPIRIDGSLDDAAWAAATPITEFRQLDPQEGQPATERTEIRVLYDDQALYIGARLHDRQAVRSRLGRRDMSMSASDWLTVILDSNHDHRTAVGFEVNPAGVRRDQTRAQDGSEDDSWDPVWEAETSVSDSGWVAEMRIPFSQMRFSAAPVQTWGLQVERQIARNQEFSVWSFTPRDQPGGIPRFGHLAGLERIPTGKRLEVLPYAVTRAENVERGANPFREDREYGMDVGVDLKYRLSSNMTLDATVNPDFGQVEVD
ncbi:MAG TPA: sugar-binding protein, partial [Longimicrobium sp.]|nr:sugar-binding protein [Longimicrobium sp.]